MRLWTGTGPSALGGNLQVRMVMLLMLLLLLYMICKVDTTQCPVSDSLPIPHEWHQTEDLLIGGIASQIIYIFRQLSFEEHPSKKLFEIPFMVTKFYQHVTTLAFAVNEINKDPKLLPNITLGFHICDSYYDMKLTYRTTMELLFKSQKFIPNYKCDNQRPPIMAIIGGLGAEISFRMSDILRLYNIPQLTYGSFSLKESFTMQSASFYRMVPNEAHQYAGIIHLLKHFRWRWVGLLAVDDESGAHFLQVLEPLLSQSDICSAFVERIPKQAVWFTNGAFNYMNSNMHDHFRDKKANVFVLYGETMSIILLKIVANYLDEEIEKVWIMTAQIDFALTRFGDPDLGIFHGTISFSIHSKDPQAFDKWLWSIKPCETQANGFLKLFWEQAFDCFFPSCSEPMRDSDTCSGKEKLGSLPGPFFETHMTGHSYSIYNAVYAVAHALNSLISSRLRHGATVTDKRDELQELHPWQLHLFLQGISLNNSAGETVSFNDNREMEGGFDIMNMVIFPNNSFLRVKVGKMNPKELEGEELTINEDIIVWPKYFNQVLPISLCSHSCNSGSQKKKKEGEKFCCYDCISCPEGKVSNMTDTQDCYRCPEDQYPNKKKDGCIPKVIAFLSYEEPLGTSAFGIIFSIAVSCVLAKTITVVAAFMATKPGSNMRKWVGKRLATSIVLSCSLMQALLCAIWLGTSAPFPDLDMHSVPGEIVAECNEGSLIMFYCLLGYMGLLAIISFTVAFLARKLPDSFNEAKFITFSMLVFCSVWLSFVPTYLSTKGKYMVAVEVFSILASSAGLLGCIFFPKCYIILLKPEMNKKEQLMRRK
ncbi:hypothetical protein EYD10_18336 [Varanus komodoensis]|nr:hypothetical protein EYD10_18336 [Varanus komodoensis]